jgi:two-component system, NtrC family, response regulator AtoC
MVKVLLVDDEEKIRASFSKGLEGMGYEVATVGAARAALEKIAEDTPDIVISDLVMPEMDGLSLLAEIKERNPNLPVIIITGHGTIETAVRAMKEGAFDYVTKPFNLDEVELVLSRAVEHARLLAENIALRSQIEKKFSFDNIIGESDAMQEVYRILDKVKDTHSSVLITGESGTGKELIAKAIHFNGFLKDKPFITVDCASISENLLESELFGHVRGAFTGAHRDKTGYFEAADGGTIFLDEIAEFSTHLQTKMLRSLQEGEIAPVGSSRVKKVNVRVIAATNRDLASAVRLGQFREDLFYRLNVIHVRVPPLRERIEDIPRLVESFLGRFNEKFGKKIKRISSDSLSAFARYDWPGNVRELENVMERLVIFCDDRIILPHHLPESLRRIAGQTLPADPIQELINTPYKEAKNHAIRRFNEEYLRELLKASEGNVSEASRKSGVDRGCFYRLMRRYGIPHELAE